jgi:hypothetical protein
MNETWVMPRFTYTDAERSTVWMRIPACVDCEVLVVGEDATPDNGWPGAAYEWVVVSRGKVEKHSDVGYGSPSIALRDGLTYFHGDFEGVTRR